MPRLDESSDDLVRALRTQLGSSDGLPGPGASRTPWFDRIARVALHQVASPNMTAAALDALRGAGLLDPAALGAANPLAIDDILKDARVAVALRSLRPLQKLARWATEQSPPLDEAGLTGRSTEALRDEWRAINGVGPALADRLLLYGLGRPSFPVDRASFRILVRHGWLDLDAEYDEARATVGRFASRSESVDEASDPDDPSATADALAGLLADLGAWFAKIGRDYCKPRRPRCERCPLNPWLPPSGPVEVE